MKSFPICVNKIFVIIISYSTVQLKQMKDEKQKKKNTKCTLFMIRMKYLLNLHS